MSMIGENRLRMYELLYSHPLYEIINEKKEINVLILGNGWVGIEAFKAAFWCGQYPNTRLNITIGVEDPDGYEALLKEKLPGLNDFAKFHEDETPKHCYANIRIKEVSYREITDSGLSEDELGPNGLNVAEQGYIIISVGNSFADHYNVASIAEAMPTYAQVFAFSEPSEEITDDRVHFLAGNSDKPVRDRLLQFARSINFMYTMQEQHNRADREEVDRKFDESFEDEFVNSISSSERVDASISNFLGRPYNCDSSLTNAVHEKYKYHFCDESGTEKEQIMAMNAAIEERSDIYKELVKWEHRRWNAFMISRGYRYPGKTERKQLYVGDITRKDDEPSALWHICICDCESRGKVLEPHSPDWNDPNINQLYSELDCASILCHQALARKTKNVREDVSDDLKWLKDSGCSEYKALNESIEKMLNDDSDAYVLYVIAMRNAKAEAAKNNAEKEKLDALEKKLILLAEKCKKVNFLDYDKQLIDYLPICRQMCSEPLTIVTVIDEPAFSDLIIPWTLFPQKAVFLINKELQNAQRIPKSIQTFFGSHGNCTDAVIECIDMSCCESIQAAIDRHIGKAEYPVLCISHLASPAAILAIGQYYHDIPIISYDRNAKIVPYNDGFILPQSYHTNDLLVNDLFGIMGWDSYDINNPILSSAACDCLEKEEYKDPILWNKAIGVLKNCKIAADGTVIFTASNEKRVGNAIQFILIQMEKQRIISGLSVKDHRVNYCVQEKPVYKELTEKEGTLFELSVYYRLLRSGMFDDVKTGVHVSWRNVVNEFDEICIYNGHPVFVSCKTSKLDDKKYKSYIYEISSEAETLNGIPVLAIPHDLSRSTDGVQNTIIIRAKAMNVALLDAHILLDKNLLKKALRQILTGEYQGPDTI